jgi:hypothetical protein
MRTTASRAVLITLLAWSLVTPHASQAQLTGNPADNVKYVEVVSIDGRAVDLDSGFVIEGLVDSETLDFVIKGYGIRPGDGLFLLVKPEAAETYTCFGPAKQQRHNGQTVWIIADVVLPSASGAARKHFNARAATTTSGCASGTAVESLDRFDTISSPPLSIAVNHWTPDAGGLSIETINGEPVSPSDKLVVPPSGDISVSTKATGAISIISHPSNSDVYQVAGWCERLGDRSYCRDVRFVQPGQPQWRSVAIFAIETDVPPPLGRIELPQIRARMRDASHAVRLWVTDGPAQPDRAGPKLSFDEIVMPDGFVQPVLPTDQLVELAAAEFELRGSVENLGHGAYLSAIIAPPQSPVWIVQDGPAIVSQGKWMFPRIVLPDSIHGGIPDSLIGIIVSHVPLPSGAIQSRDWRELAEAAVFLRIRGGSRSATDKRYEPALEITRIFDGEVSSQVRQTAGSSGEVVVRAEGLPPAYNVWVGWTRDESDDWVFVPAIRRDETEWWIPQFRVQGANEAPVRLIAIAGARNLPPPAGPFERWQPFAAVASPTVSVLRGFDTSGVSSAGIDFRNPGMLTWLWCVAVLLVLFWMQYAWGNVAPACKLVASNCEEIARESKGAIQDLPRPKAVPSVWGVILAIVGLGAIYLYLPVYSHVLRSVLGLSRDLSGNLALVMVGFVVLAGVTAHFTLTYGRPTKPGMTQVLYVFVVTVVVLFAVALLFFQAVIYVEFYRSQAQAGSLVPVAFGAAALFIAGIELVNFFWVTSLTKEFLPWIFFSLIFAIPLLLAKVALLCEQLFASIPRARPPSENKGLESNDVENGSYLK